MKVTEFLKQLFTRNIPLKLLALVLAFVCAVILHCAV